MNRGSIFTFSAITALGLAQLPSGIVAQQGTLKQQLVGTWSLASYSSTPPSQFGISPKGLLILAADGHYAEVFGRPDRAKFKNAAEPTTEERASAQGGFAANFGTWSVSDPDKTLTQHFEAALVPNNEGIDLKSSVSIAGDDLKLTRVLPSTGNRQEFSYRRVR